MYFNLYSNKLKIYKKFLNKTKIKSKNYFFYLKFYKLNKQFINKINIFTQLKKLNKNLNSNYLNIILPFISEFGFIKSRLYFNIKLKKYKLITKIINKLRFLKLLPHSLNYKL